MKEDISECVQIVMDKTVESYKAVLKQYFPSFEKRFMERNLTFFFAHNYLNHVANSIVWQELPIKIESNSRTGHIDTLIIDSENKFIIFIEAKCLARESRLNKRSHEILRDLKRLNDSIKLTTNTSVYPQFPEEVKGYAKYALILADIWSSEEETISEIDKSMSDIIKEDTSLACKEIFGDRKILKYEFGENPIEKILNYNIFYHLYKF